MSTWTRLAIVALTAGALAGQTASGEIAGRLTDRQQSVLPGVRVRVLNGNQAREAITDGGGRFSFPSVPFGQYRVTAELAGFKPLSGTIVISPPTPIAFLRWSLEVGCIGEVQRVILGLKAAAPLVEAIVHIRVEGPARTALVSVAPDCAGRVFRRYSVQVLDRVSGRGRTSLGQRDEWMEPRNAELGAGREYVALLWSDSSTSDDLVLPVTSGRVVSAGAGELNGLGVREALTVLAKWAAERGVD
jgi:hypothetical protein